MASDNVGVQRCIRDQSPKAVYVYCSGHCLNLVIAHSCSLPVIRNTSTSYRHFYQAHLFIISALESIAYGVNGEPCGDDFHDASWDPKSKGDAASLLTSLTSFNFIIIFLVLYEIPSHLADITIKLQGWTLSLHT